MGVNNDKLDETFTAFPAAGATLTDLPLSGRFAAYFKSFFSRKKGRGRPSLTVDHPLAGDSVKNPDSHEGGGTLGFSKSNHQVPKLEYERRKRYKDYEKMDEYPEIGSAMDIYADDATQEHIDGDIITVEVDSPKLKNMVKEFIAETKLNEYIWDIARNVCKYGDCFVENIIDLNNPEAGIQRLKILNPGFVLRQEDKFGYLKGFEQEVPKTLHAPTPEFGSTERQQKIKLEPTQLVHFRVYTSDPNYYPYGKSLLAPAVRSWQSLRWMEEAMLIYRLHRAPERRIFYVETGNLPTARVEVFMERIKAKLKKEKFFNQDSFNTDERFNPISAEEDFFIPWRNGQGTKVETLPGAQNLGDIDDVRYFRDKVLAALKVPKDFIVEKDKSPERKANLSQLDAKFAKAVLRVQRDIEVGITTLVDRHLQFRGVHADLRKSVKIKLAPTSDLNEKRKLEIAEQQARVVQAVQGLELFSKEYLLKIYFKLSESEIAEINRQRENEQSEESDAATALGGGQPPMPGMPAPGMPGMPPGAPGEGLPNEQGNVPPKEEPR